ncbi:epoxyqueuosine reductase QueH [uncultured Eubacterium sp.]|uniref:epoxyqueuosine reductase QueH n=1 Tax=uncultured Eubacterium sp. TaxID=165185 RepID=UPI002673710B|nr:epoxyqueuosine reductase QueH [uncultured Eubacterium sp.]
MNKINYQKELENELKIIQEKKIIPNLLLHVCCAPCSSYVLEYLTNYFNITALFYNPNISSEQEYLHRAQELKRFVNEKKFVNNVEVIIENYLPNEFYNVVQGLEDCKEGGNRCFQCYKLRLENTALKASKENYDYFTTTLSISPLKNAEKLNEIGKELSKQYNIKYLYSDFKKKEGYKRSIELSREYNLYRQNFCGCKFSKMSVEGKEK